MKVFRIMFLFVLLIAAIASVSSCSGGKSDEEKVKEALEENNKAIEETANKLKESLQ